MKIVYIYKSIALLAGMERILTDKMNYLVDKLGHEVYLLTYEQDTHPFSYPLSSLVKYVDLGVLLYTKGRYSFPKRLWIYWRMRKTLKERLRSALQEICPDIVVFTNYSFPIIDIIVSSANQSKLVLETHLAKDAVLKRADFPKFSLTQLFAWMYDCYMLHYIKKTDVLVALTEQDKEKWKKICPTVVISNVLTFYPDAIASLDEKRIISVGRYDVQKGYDLFIRAWSLIASRYQDWSVDIYGEGNSLVLREMAQKYGVDRSFQLHASTADIYKEYLKHSVYVMSSRYEGFGLVLIEAMSCGLPCISFDCPSGPGEIIRDGEDGILVENGNVEKLAEAVSYLIENELERRRMGINARKNCLRYSKESIMSQWDTLFHNLIREK